MEFLAKLDVLRKAVPVWGAALQAVLVAFAAGVVPLLPVDVGVKVGAAVASLIAAVAAVVKVVSMVTPVPREARGVELPPGHVLDVEVTYPGGSASLRSPGH